MKIRDRPVAFLTGFVVGSTFLFILQSQHILLSQTTHSRMDKSQNLTKETKEEQIWSSKREKKRDDYEDIYRSLSRVTEIQTKLLEKNGAKEDGEKKTLAQLHEITVFENASSFEKFQLQISEESLYNENSIVIDQVLKDMSRLPFKSLDMKEGGTQLKLVIDFQGGGQALYKPMRFQRNQTETWPNHFYFSDFERHTAEIAAFHLDRILGFRRAPPVTGRKVNHVTDVRDLAPSDLLRTFFVSPIGSVCFVGKCSYYCDTGHAFCGNPEMSEASLAAFLPSKDIADRRKVRHPWRRSYSKYVKADWETDNGYCNSVRQESPYNSGRIMLDLMDMSVYDFLTGNMDRHHYEIFKIFDKDPYAIHLDHGRAFGKAYHDELSCLAPLQQCCMIRASTLSSLLQFHNGAISLGETLKISLKSDPVDPVLLDQHFSAIDRRVGIILELIRTCLQNNHDHSKVIYTKDSLYHYGGKAKSVETESDSKSITKDVNKDNNHNDNKDDPNKNKSKDDENHDNNKKENSYNNDNQNKNNIDDHNKNKEYQNNNKDGQNNSNKDVLKTNKDEKNNNDISNNTKDNHNSKNQNDKNDI